MTYLHEVRSSESLSGSTPLHSPKYSSFFELCVNESVYVAKGGAIIMPEKPEQFESAPQI